MIGRFLIVEVHYLPSAEVLLIHDHAIREFGGSFGLVSPGRKEEVEMWIRDKAIKMSCEK